MTYCISIRERTVLELMKREGRSMTSAEIGEILGWTIREVSAVLVKARYNGRVRIDYRGEGGSDKSTWRLV